MRRIAAGVMLAAALAGRTAGARQVDLTILHTTDLHGHVLPTVDYDGRAGVGGLLRCATLIERVRAERPNTLLVDCGDLFQGSAESYLTDGRIMTRALEWLRYDAWVLGNHEFDWGLPVLQALHDATSLNMLGANIVGRPGLASPLPRVKPYVIREVDGVRVAIVGLITPGVPSWSTPDLLGSALFERSVAALRRVLPQVRAEDPDILLLATHQGFRTYGDDHANEVNAIAREFPDFDAILGGHSHQPVERALVGGQMLFTQAGYYGIWLGQLDLTYDTVARKVVQKQARLHRVDEQVPRHPELEAIVREDLDRAEAYLGERVGSAANEIPFATDAYGRSPVQTLICRAIAEAADAEIVLHGLLDEAALAEGPLTMADVWRVVPYENRIAVALLTAGELEEILRENGQRRNNLQFMGAWGLQYEWGDEGGGAVQIRNLRLADGSDLHPRKRFRVAMNSYVVASGGQRFPRLREIVERPESRLRLLEVDTRSAVRDYIRAHSPLSVESLGAGAASP